MLKFGSQKKNEIPKLLESVVIEDLETVDVENSNGESGVLPCGHTHGRVDRVHEEVK